MIGRLKLLGLCLITLPCFAHATSIIELDDKALQTRARDAAASGIKSLWSDPHGACIGLIADLCFTPRLDLGRRR
jgi:hypothetical protein